MCVSLYSEHENLHNVIDTILQKRPNSVRRFGPHRRISQELDPGITVFKMRDLSVGYYTDVKTAVS